MIFTPRAGLNRHGVGQSSTFPPEATCQGHVMGWGSAAHLASAPRRLRANGRPADPRTHSESMSAASSSGNALSCMITEQAGLLVGGTGTIMVKFGKRELSIALSDDETIGGLKATLEDLTCVESKRQKLIGVPARAADSSRLSDLELKPRLMLVGTPSALLEQAAADEAAGLAAAAETVNDDFELTLSGVGPTGTPLDKDAEALSKVAARAEQYSKFVHPLDCK